MQELRADMQRKFFQKEEVIDPIKCHCRVNESQTKCPSFDLATWKSLGGLDETCFGRLVGTKACLEHS